MPHEHVHLLGISELDEDHLTVGYIIAELELSLEHNAPRSAIARVAGRVIQSTQAHFVREEEMMARDEYPFLERHRQSHHELLEFIENLKGQVSAGHTVLNKELIAALWDWETAHIDTSDRGYADYVLKQNAGRDVLI